MIEISLKRKVMIEIGFANKKLKFKHIKNQLVLGTSFDTHSQIKWHSQQESTSLQMQNQLLTKPRRNYVGRY